MDELTRAWLKVVIDGQAWLYASAMTKGQEGFGNPTIEDFMNDWKEESEKLVQELLNDDSSNDAAVDDGVG